MTPIQTQMMALRRQSFTGRTDKYAVPRQAPTSVNEMIRKDLGFVDVTSGEFTDFYKETAIDRQNAYKKALDFYEGKHWKVPEDAGEPKPVNNFCSTVVDKTTDFMFGSGLGIGSTPGNELVASFLDKVWTYNRKNLLYYNLCMACSLFGDAFVYVAYGEDGRIRLIPLNPQFCFPVFERDSNTIKAILIQYPGDLIGPTGSPVMHSMYITSEFFKEFTDTQEEASKRVPNALGFVPVVHIPNTPIPGKLFGRSDIADIVPLNEEYNVTNNRMRRIIAYHAEPTTIIYGAKASQLQKGANKVWSGLPADGKVENLVLNTDLAAIQTYLGNIERSICRKAEMPKCAFDSDVAVSNTSGVAIRLLYKPLLDKVGRKRVAFTEGVVAINNMILRVSKAAGFDASTELADVPEQTRYEPIYSESIPPNENEILDAETKKLAQGLTSKAESFRTINIGKDLTRISSEVLMDQRAQLALDAEKAKALAGRTPNMSAPFLGSLAANEDLQAFAKRLDKEAPTTETEEETTEEETNEDAQST